MNASDEATLVIVGGPPASGKSTLTQRLSDDLRIPALSKDDFKEALFDSIGSRDREWSRRLGKASFELLVSCASKLVASGVSCIVESTFRPEDAFRFETMRQCYGARMLQVFCTAPRDEICERFRQRTANGRRHPGHLDESNIDELIQLIEDGTFVPLDVSGPLIRIDTGAASRREFRSAYPSILSSFLHPGAGRA